MQQEPHNQKEWQTLYQAETNQLDQNMITALQQRRQAALAKQTSWLQFNESGGLRPWRQYGLSAMALLTVVIISWPFIRDNPDKTLITQHEQSTIETWLMLELTEADLQLYQDIEFYDWLSQQPGENQSSVPAYPGNEKTKGSS